eukprot:gene6177-12511_t
MIGSSNIVLVEREKHIGFLTQQLKNVQSTEPSREPTAFYPGIAPTIEPFNSMTTGPSREPAMSISPSQTSLTVDQVMCDVVAAWNGSSSLPSTWSCNSNNVPTTAICSWTGLTCTRGVLTAITLSELSISGTMPTSLGALRHLNSLMLTSLSSLDGSIPSSLGLMTVLTKLTLSGNRLTGNIPSEISLMSSLLYVQNNKGLTCYSTCLSSKTDVSFGTANNACNEVYTPPTIAPTLTSLIIIPSMEPTHSPTSLTVDQVMCDVVAAWNGSASLPSTWSCNSNNVPTTTICSWTGLTCTRGVLTAITLSELSISGTMPTSLGALRHLNSLMLTSLSSLDGSIPSSLGLMTVLTKLTLSGNRLTGNIPSEISLMSSLLYVQNNKGLTCYSTCLSSKTDVSFGTATNACNEVYTPPTIAPTLTLSLTIIPSMEPTHSPTIGIAPTIEPFNSMTTGPSREPAMSISPSQTGLTVDQVMCDLAAAWNGSSSLPSTWSCNSNNVPTTAICSWTGLTCTRGVLTAIYLNGRFLLGTMPTSLGALLDLKSLELRYVSLSGRIPSALGLMTQMTLLALSRNHFTGVIPSQISLMSSMV